MKNFLTFVLLMFSSFPVWAQEAPTYPENQGAVNDFANILSTGTKDSIRSMAASLRDTKGPCVVVVTVPSLYGLPVEDYTNNLFKRWQIGHKNNDGLIFLIAPNERKMRIEVGYGLEPVIPDLIAKAILADTVRPFLAKNKWDDGILAGTQAIITKLGGVAEGSLPAPPAPAPSKSTDPWYLTPFGIMVILIIVVFVIILAANDPTGFTGALIGAVLSGGSGSGGGGGGGSSRGESSSRGGGDSGGGGASSDF